MSPTQIEIMREVFVRIRAIHNGLHQVSTLFSEAEDHETAGLFKVFALSAEGISLEFEEFAESLYFADVSGK